MKERKVRVFIFKKSTTFDVSTLFVGCEHSLLISFLDAVDENGEANDAESVDAALEKQAATLKELAKKIAHYEAHHDQMNRDYYNRQSKIYKIRNMCCRYSNPNLKSPL